jgi:putative Mn2+ efflux pump MntP
MNFAKIAGVLLIVAGVLGLVYGGFSYTKDEHVASIGKLELKMQEKETVSVPLVVSIAAIAAGVGLLVGFGKK